MLEQAERREDQADDAQDRHDAGRHDFFGLEELREELPGQSERDNEAQDQPHLGVAGADQIAGQQKQRTGDAAGDERSFAAGLGEANDAPQDGEYAEDDKVEFGL